MFIPMMSVPLPRDMKDVVVKDDPKQYEARYEKLDKDGNCVRSQLIRTDSLPSFETHLIPVLFSPGTRLIYIRLGRREATLRWSETVELPDSPI